ncbi:MAG TPA: ATP synthase F1 subunit epsilon [Bacteroidales bacterium]|nr:ATP synthase F1 subunit epsilon [Bacteroidales bacterium]
MAERSLLLEILTPEKSLYKGRVVLVRLPGTLGPFEILYNHAPLVSTLQEGNIKIIDLERNRLDIPIKGGVIEVKNNHIVILTS